jgi:hypothetical protein
MEGITAWISIVGEEGWEKRRENELSARNFSLPTSD